MCYTTGPPQISRHSWFQSLYGLSVLPDQHRSRPPMVPERSTGGWGGVPRHRPAKSAMGPDLPAVPEPPGQSSRAPDTGGRFHPPIGYGSPGQVEIGHLTRPRGHIFGGISGLQVLSCNCVWIEGGASPSVAGELLVDLY